MNARLASSTLAVSAFFAFVGHATNYATGLYGNQQSKATTLTGLARYPGGCNIMLQTDNLGNPIVLCDNPNSLQIATKDQPQYGHKNEVAACQYEVSENGEKKYYLANYQEGNANSVSTRCADTDKSLGLDGSLSESPAHLHPIKVAKDGGRLSALWPSNQDVLSALLKGENTVRIIAQPQNSKAKNAAIVYDINERKCWLLGKNGKPAKEIMLTNYGVKTIDGEICWQADKKDNGCYRVENLPDPLTYRGDINAFSSRYGHNAFNPNDLEKLIEYVKKFKLDSASAEVRNERPDIDSTATVGNRVDGGDWDVCKCAVPDLFIKNAKGDPTLKVVENYHHPGESIKEPETSSESSVASIDTSKLEVLLKERIDFVESLLKSGKRATNWQLSKDNSRAQDILSELKKLDEGIRSLNVSDAEKTKIAEDLAEKVKKTDKQLSQLMKKAIEQNLVPGLSQLPSNGMKETVSRSSGDDIVCICDNPNPFAVKVSSGIPASVSCENCGRLIGIEVNGRISSSNPAAKDKTARAVSFDEANAIKQRFQGRK